MILAPIACITDALENFQIQNIIKDINGNIELFLIYLRLYTWLKWGSLAIIFLIFGTHFLKSKKWLWGIVAILPFCLMPFAYFSYNIINEIFAMSVVVNFLILFIFIIIEYKNQTSINSYINTK